MRQDQAISSSDENRFERFYARLLADETALGIEAIAQRGLRKLEIVVRLPTPGCGARSLRLSEFFHAMTITYVPYASGAGT